MSLIGTRDSAKQWRGEVELKATALMVQEERRRVSSR